MFTKLRNSYHNTSEWAHHHTAVLVLGLTMTAAAFGWQFGSYFIGEDKTYAAEPSAQHLLCDARELSLSLQIPLSECYILADFYEATDGDNWYNTQNNNAAWFQNPGTICSGGWYGINSCYYDGMLGKYSIQSLTFPRSRQGNNLNGYIPSSLYSLPRLDSIHITRNPNLVVNLDDMTQSPYAANFVHINVHNNILNGNINNFINMPDLRYLDISCYTDANLDDCTATGDTSFVLSLPRLEALRVGGHAGVVVNLSHLENSPLLTQVYALDSYVEGDLSSLTGATGMQTLDVSCWNQIQGLCNVTGNLDALQNMTDLEYLSLDALLNIEGTLDVLYDKVQLRQIDLSHNKITGTIGAGIGNLTLLDALDLDDNLLEGTLPEEMYNLVLLTRLNLDDNALVGSLLDFRMFPVLEDLDIGANNMDYSNVWDMIVPDQNPLCILAEDPCTPNNSTLKKLGINNADIHGVLPDVWYFFPDLIELNLQFNKITGPFPPSFEALTNLSEFQIRFNNLDGDIPAYLAAMQLDEGKFAIEANCLNTDVTDPDLLALLTGNSPGWNNQLNCRANVRVSSESASGSLAPGQCTPYTIYYENFGPQQAINLTIGQAFGENIVASGQSIPPYEEGLVGREYATANDPCYIQATQFGTGPYFAAYENLLINDSQYDFASIYDLALVLGQFLGDEPFTGAQGTTEFAYVLDNFCPFVFGTSDHYLCLLLFGMDLKEIDDPSCGYGGEPGYVRDLSTVPTGGSGSIQLQICNETEGIEVLSCSDINVDTISENENQEECTITVESEPVCGNGIQEELEQCDDGNTASLDGCSATCQDELPEEPQAYCGDGNIDGGEQCDDGEGNGQPPIGQPPYGSSGSIAYCTESCTNASASYQGGYCGDGIVNGPEYCDGGENCNGCMGSKLPIDEPPVAAPYCGDNIVNGEEQCDGTINCNKNCTFKSLGSRDRQASITIDYCPDGIDYTESYYDHDCGVPPTLAQHGSPEELDNLIDDPVAFQKAVSDVTKSMQCNIGNESVRAYVFAFDLKITTINNICNANLQGEVTREEFAKFISTYAITVLNKKPDTTRKCAARDLSKTTTEMQTFAKTSCELNIMGLKQDGDPDVTFRPKDRMTRAEVFTALNRLVNGTMDNSKTGLRYTKHMNRLVEQKIVFDTSAPQRNTLRAEVLLMLMRAYGVIKNR